MCFICSINQPWTPCNTILSIIEKYPCMGFPIVVHWKQIWPVSMRMLLPSMALLSRLGIQHWCELWCRLQMHSEPMILWLWCRLTAAAPIQPLAWEPPYATSVALKKKKVKKNTHVWVNPQSSNPCCSRVNCNNDYHLIQPHLLTTIFFFLSHQFSICLFLAPRQIWGPLFCYSTTLCKFYSFISLNCCHYFTCYHICNTLLQEKHM